MQKDEGQRFGPNKISMVRNHTRQAIVGLILALSPLFWKGQIHGLSHGNGESLRWGLSHLGFVWILLVVLWSLLQYRSKGYFLSERGVIVKYGVYNQKIDLLRYDMIFDCEVRRTSIDGWLGIGTLLIKMMGSPQGGGERTISLSCVSDPESAMDSIVSRLGKITALGSV
jgi:uncharacterized membrane protein YdbT with pleckstrin-like domain